MSNINCTNRVHECDIAFSKDLNCEHSVAPPPSYSRAVASKATDNKGVAVDSKQLTYSHQGTYGRVVSKSNEGKANDGKRYISTKFSGKWVRKSPSTIDRKEEREFLSLLGKSKLEVECASNLGSKVQIVQQFAVHDTHYIRAQVYASVHELKVYQYDTRLLIDGHRQRQPSPGKGFGDDECTSVSKFTSSASYRTVYHLEHDRTLTIDRTLINDNSLCINQKVQRGGKTASCAEIYVRSFDWSARDRRVISRIRREGGEECIYA